MAKVKKVKVDVKRMEDEVESLATATILSALKGDAKAEEKSTLAIKALNVIAKKRRDYLRDRGLNLNMAKTLFDKDELKQYIAVTQPEIKKALKSA